MGTYDTVIATITCPCCKTRHLNEDIQTKDLSRRMDTIYEGDNTKNLDNSYHRRKCYLPHSFDGIKNMEFDCLAQCQACTVYLDLKGIISNYVLVGVVAVSFEERNPKKTIDGVNIHLLDGLGPDGRYAAKEGLLIP